MFVRQGALSGFILVLCVSLSGCTTGAPESSPRISNLDPVPLSDPLEDINRVVFAFNDGVDSHILRPVSQMYQAVIPDPVRASIRNFLRHVSSPVIILNDLLQGESRRAETTISRFLVNTTVGLGGFFDPATDFGLPYHYEGFGQTLAVWQKKEDSGPYLVIPFLGPSSPQALIGFGVDSLSHPFTWTQKKTQDMRVTGQVVGLVDTRVQLGDTLESLKNSTDDYYAAIRSFYEQNRDHDLRNGRVNLMLPAPGDDDF